MGAALVRVSMQECTPGSTGWQDVDMDSYGIDADAVGVWLLFENTDATTAYAGDARKNGSTDNLSNNEVFEGRGCAQFVGIDANGVAEIDVGSTSSIDVYCMGYMTDAVTMFTDLVDKSESTTGSYQDVDVTSDTSADAVMVFVKQHCDGAHPTAYNNFLRKNGSSDDRYANADTYQLHTAGNFVGLDANEIYETKIENTTTDTYLAGYYDGEKATLNTNATENSLGTTSTWTDLSAMPSGAKVGLFSVHNSGSSGEWGFRKNGESETPSPKIGGSDWLGLAVELDSNRVAEGYVGNTDIDFFEIGYFEDESGFVDAVCAIAASSSLSIDTLALRNVLSSISASSSLSISPHIWRSVLASITAGSSLSVGAMAVRNVLASISATGSLSLDADMLYSALANISATASMSAQHAEIHNALIAISIASSLSLDAGMIREVAASISSTASMSAGAMLARNVLTAISAAASVSADNVRVRNALADISSTAALTALALRVVSGDVVIDSAATVDAIAQNLRSAAAALSASVSADINAGMIRNAVANIVASPNILITFILDAICAIAAAATVAADGYPGIRIDIGEQPSSTASYADGDYTYVMKENPANMNGYINHIYVRSTQEIPTLDVGTFYVSDTNKLTCRDKQTFSNVPGSSEQHLSAHLHVKTGDLIGFRSTNVPGSEFNIYMHEDGWDGYYRRNGSFSAGVEESYSSYGSDNFWIYGIGITPGEVFDGEADISSVATLSLEAKVAAILQVAISVAASLSPQAEALAAEAICNIVASCALNVAGMFERVAVASIIAAASISVVSGIIVIKTMGYDGTFADGDLIVINTETKTITKNGTNVLKDFTGNFWSLLSGENSVIYSDDESSRSVEIEIRHKDRFA